MADDLLRTIPRLATSPTPLAIDPGVEASGDLGTEGDEPLDIGGSASIILSNPEAAETLRRLQDSAEFREYRVYLDEFSAFLNGKMTLRHFRPHEFLAMGGSHGSPGASCFGLNSLPPKPLWDNVVPLAKVIDELRHRLGAPVSLSSVYRNRPYNSCIGGENNSHHMKFHAADWVCQDGRGSSHWHSVAKDLRAEGFFKGGIGKYASFIHVDTRGLNVDW